MEFAVAADHVFDGTGLRRDCAVIIEGARIRRLMAHREAPVGIPTRRLPEGAWLAPGLIDIQVNGGGDVLFNDDPSPAGLAAIAAAHRRFGTTALLPTLLSDTQQKMRAARDAVEAVADLEPSVIGVHFEGPLLSAEKRGVQNANQLKVALDISPTLAARLWRGDFTQIGMISLDRLCRELDCQPGDLLRFDKKRNVNAQARPK